MTAAEVASVKQQYIAEDAYKRDGTAGVASELSEWIGVGDWTLYVTFPQTVQQVTAADVQRVAKKYFAEDQSTTGWFVPVAATRRRARDATVCTDCAVCGERLGGGRKHGRSCAPLESRRASI